MDAATLLQQLRDAERAYRTTLEIVQHRGGRLFKAVRQEYGLTQRQFADILKVDFSFISKVENGHIRPGKPVLERLATFLADQPSTVQDGSQPPQATPPTTPPEQTL